MIENNSENNVDRTTKGTITSGEKIEVIEVNVPSSQALKNFSIRLIEIKEKLQGGVKVSA